MACAVGADIAVKTGSSIRGSGLAAGCAAVLSLSEGESAMTGTGLGLGRKALFLEPQMPQIPAVQQKDTCE